jgi:mRNA-degrading endonuclease RelE of RelBE toxin-antitoxin system
MIGMMFNPKEHMSNVGKKNMRRLRQFLRGRAKSLSLIYKVEKEKLILLVDELHLGVESTPLME